MFLLLILVGVLFPAATHAGLLEDARQAVRYTVQDSSGYSVRGGVNLPTGQAPGGQALVRANVSIGGMGCGAFDLGASLQEAFTTIPQLLMNAGQGIVGGLPLLVICYADPGLCDNIKHWQGVLNAAISAKYARCQQIQSAMAYAGARLREGEHDSCLEDELQRTQSIGQALDNCAAPSSLRLPNGLRGGQINLIEDVLREAGASQENITLANALLGEVTVRAGQRQIGVTSRRSPTALLQDYERRRAEALQAYQTAVQEKHTTGTVSAATLEAISVPGQVFPEVAIDALMSLENDPERLAFWTGALATSKAITDLTWKCHELELELREATATNPRVNDESRRMIEERLKLAREERHQLLEKVSTVSTHYQPTLNKLIEESAASQELARQAGLRAPGRNSQQGPYRTQTPLGTSR